MKALFENLLSSFSSSEKPRLDEAEQLLADIEEAITKMHLAWNHLDHAAPEYVDIAVLELLISETQYSLLNRRYCLMQGIEKEYPYFPTSTGKALSFSLKNQLQNHAFYRTFFNPTSESPFVTSPKIISQNHAARDL